LNAPGLPFPTANNREIVADSPSFLAILSMAPLVLLALKRMLIME
jgi:hypothetical protein